MEIRRPIAALLTALALVGGGSATLSACGSPSGADRNDGTNDKSTNTSGNNPGSNEQGNLPDTSNKQPSQ